MSKNVHRIHLDVKNILFRTVEAMKCKKLCGHLFYTELVVNPPRTVVGRGYFCARR